MFNKILIANRGEIAVRVIRTCREMGIAAVALYSPPDLHSLHVRLADEAVELPGAESFMDAGLIVSIAKERGVDAIHPGYGFMAEEPAFIQACEAAGITFIGPAAAVVGRLRGKLQALERARAAGFPTVTHSPISFGPEDVDALQASAGELSYPLVIKSCSGGRGRGERLVRTPDRLEEAMRRALVESRAVFGTQQLYLEKAILPAHQIGVQILADTHGNIIHLGEREGSLIYSNQKVIEESPAPCLLPGQREALWQTAVDLARLFQYENAGTVEFLVNGDGTFYFSEIKARIQVEHPVTEMRANVDLVREQIRIAAGERLSLRQEDVRLSGWAILCRVNAEDPWENFMPSPGLLRRVRLPGGPAVRVDTYAYCGCSVPARYDPLIAKLTVWAADRETCVQRLRRALEDFTLIGTPTNLPLLQRILHSKDFIDGRYSTDFLVHPFGNGQAPQALLQDLAVAAAVMFVQRNQRFNPSVPERLRSGWHRESRRLPQ